MSGRKKFRSNEASRLRAIAVAAAAALCALAIVGYMEASDPRFALVSVVILGEKKTAAVDILDAAALSKGSNVWLLDTAAATRRVVALPWIESARVSRAWPNHVTVTVTERLPVARIIVPAGGDAEEPTQQVALIDATLRVLAVGLPGGQAGALPLFRIEPQPTLQPGSDASGSDVEHAYDAMVQLRALGLRISEVDLKPSTGVTVTCDGGMRVILGSDDDFARKVSLFKAIAPKIATPENVVYVDLRSVRAPTVLYR